MKECEMKFIITENLIETTAERFGINLMNKENANRKLEEIIKDYMMQNKIAEKIQVKISDKQ